MKSFQAALKADATYVPARLGLAAVAAAGNPPAAKEAIEQALKVNPNSVTAQLLMAEMALDDRRRDDAREAIDKALKVNPKSLDALSLRAAVDFVEGKQTDFETHAKEVLAINPRYGDVFRIAGDHAARNYLFDEAVALTRRAHRVGRRQPDCPRQPGHAPAAHRATSPRRGGRSSARSRTTPTTSSPSTRWRCWIRWTSSRPSRTATSSSASIRTK